MGDRLELRGLRLVAAHGALPEEHTRAQPFELDVDVEFDASASGRTDRLTDTLDYGALVNAVATAFHASHADLLEHLAARVAGVILEQPLVDGVTVTVRKLRPPVPHDLASAAVTITRHRGGAPSAGAGADLGRGSASSRPDSA